MLKLYIWLAPALLLVLELVLVLSAGMLILLCSKGKARHGEPPLFLSAERMLARLARRRIFSIFAVGLFVVVVRLALQPILGTPQPGAHDEFSYLLAADTFAHGRFTNPTHPMWIHFESFHIIEKPTYTSMYPPAQGLVLAAGQILGHPWIGQLLTTALMCSALCWMLQGWVPPTWALFGAVLAALRLGILSYWMNGYFAASIVALGGALVLGAWPRLRLRLRVRDALLMALGLAILANSRPYEGLVFSMPVAFAMMLWLFGKAHPRFSQSIPRVVAPIVLVLLAAALATGYYYYRVTGNPFRMTYQVNADMYSSAPFFLWQTPRHEPQYHHVVMHDFYHRELMRFEIDRTFLGGLRFIGKKFISWWKFYLGPLLTLPLIALPKVMKQHKMRLPLLACAAIVLSSAQTWILPHYVAPATGALYLVVVQCIRRLRHWSPPYRLMGRSLVRAIPVLASAMVILRVAAAAAHVGIEPSWPKGNVQRASVSSELRQQPGYHLVIVRYGPQHDPAGSEWVYNEANIDAAKVIWARDMGLHDNEELLLYFAGRRIWLLEADDPAPHVIPYRSDAISDRSAIP